MRLFASVVISNEYGDEGHVPDHLTTLLLEEES
jgi:hypothetical protein